MYSKSILRRTFFYVPKVQKYVRCVRCIYTSGFPQKGKKIVKKVRSGLNYDLNCKLYILRNFRNTVYCKKSVQLKLSDLHVHRIFESHVKRNAIRLTCTLRRSNLPAEKTANEQTC